MTLFRRRLTRVLLGGACIVAFASHWGRRVAADSATPTDAARARLTPHPPSEPASPPDDEQEDLLPGGPSDSADGADPGPVFSRVILRLRARAQAHILGESRLIEDEKGRVVPASQIGTDDEDEPELTFTSSARNGNELGTFLPIENEAALSHFHRALEDLLSHPELKRKVRIAAYGASHTQADIYSGYLRYYLQSRFGNGGVGFVPLGLSRGWSRRLGYKVKTKGFSVQYAQQKPPPRHGRFGLSGSAAVAGPHASVRIAPRNDTDRHLAASHYNLFFAAEPRGGDLAVRFDDEAAMLLSARAASPEARYHTFVRPLGWHTVKIQSTGEGAVRLFGMSVEREQPGLVVDTLGIRGTRAANMLQWDRKIWTSHLLRRAPDLITLAYGTNETTDRGQPIEKYERELRTVLGRIRSALPAASCVLIGPGDFPRLIKKRWRTRPRLLQIIDAQRRVAPDFGCGFWDTYAFMGGAASMQEWVKARPALGSGDRIHFTIRGYVRMGMVLADALMRAYDDKHLPTASRVTSQRATSLRPVSAL